MVSIKLDRTTNQAPPDGNLHARRDGVCCLDRKHRTALLLSALRQRHRSHDRFHDEAQCNSD
jgi:hypothetical protein